MYKKKDIEKAKYHNVNRLLILVKNLKINLFNIFVK